MNRRIFGRRNVAVWVLEIGVSDPHGPKGQVRAWIGGRAGDDPVVIVREALRLLQALPTAGGAAVPVRHARGVAVERFDERLGLDGHFMLGTISEIDDLF